MRPTEPDAKGIFSALEQATAECAPLSGNSLTDFFESLKDDSMNLCFERACEKFNQGRTKTTVSFRLAVSYIVPLPFNTVNTVTE